MKDIVVVVDTNLPALDGRSFTEFSKVYTIKSEHLIGTPMSNFLKNLDELFFKSGFDAQPGEEEVHQLT
jgi:hypothetical protein